VHVDRGHEIRQSPTFCLGNLFKSSPKFILQADARLVGGDLSNA
jgi:hypothetical protein